ncbi:MAG: hypothetical protein ACREL1_02475 [bacterium]
MITVVFRLAIPSFRGLFMVNRKSILLGLLLLIAGSVPRIAWAQVPDPSQAANDFAAQASQDFQNVSTFINNQFAPNLGFFSTLGWNTPPTVFSWTSVTGPHIEIGVGVGADFFKISDTPLNLSVLDQSTETNPGQELNKSLQGLGLPGLPIPYPFANVRVGLLAGLDIGFRYSEIPTIAVSTSTYNVAAHYTGYGFDLRYKLIQGHGLPNLTMGVHWNTLNGDIALGASANQTEDYTDNGITYTTTVNGTATYDEAWNINDFGPQLMLGYNLLGFIYPYGGIGFERYSGNVTASLKGHATVTADTIPSTSPQTSNIPMQYVNVAEPTTFEPHYLVGVDIGSFWSIVGEANGPSESVNTSFQLEF